jgi:HD-GYP domain-containing protein (c-di-GMP phosphodiesterase class II)
MVGGFLATAGRTVQRAMQVHCQAAGELAIRLDLGEEVRAPLLQAFERWDGRGVPGEVGAEQLSPAIRLVQLADCLEAFHHTGGPESALEVARTRRGTQFDPDLVDAFCDHREVVLAGLDEIQAWDEVIALDPLLGATLDDDQLDVALETLGDFADLKSPTRLGHARGAATLAAEAVTSLGLDAEEARTVRRAALVQDVGMTGVPSGLWTQATPWSLAQRERARTHPYLTERMLARVPALSRVASLAAAHHERLDGSGYPRGSMADALPMPARVLAAADVYHALLENRPHRKAVPAEDARAALQDEVRDGRLDADAVQAVLGAAGHAVRRRTALPAGLTRREAEVLVLLARGLTNPQMAGRLGISRKTVSTHLEHVYAKLQVTNRTEAALFAMHHGLVGPLTAD